jgi:hypothetical protein
VVAGRWRITKSDLWGQSDTEEPYILFEPGHTGVLVVGALEAEIDWRPAERDGGGAVDFTWEGHDDGTPMCGRGWAKVGTDAGDSLAGRLFIHLGDESAFAGQREPPPRIRVPARAQSREKRRSSPR